ASLQKAHAFFFSTFSRAGALGMVFSPYYECRSSERRFVIHAAAASEGGPGRGRATPRIVVTGVAAARLSAAVVGVVAACARTTTGITGTATEAAASAAATGLGDLGRRVAQRGADLVDLEFDDRALLTLAGF